MNLQLSVAMRLGSMLSGQTFGMFRNIYGATCAWGAALTAAGQDFVTGPGLNLFNKLPDAWLWVESMKVPTPCPSRSCSFYGQVDIVKHIIVHMNDDHRWSRERIADWIATIEPPLVEQPEALEAAKVGETTEIRAFELSPLEVMELQEVAK